MPAPTPTFREALRFWLKLGFISFGGPSGQIAIMHTELVEKKKWISEDRFLHALNFCMLLPGPEATQLATYCGWLLHRTWGGIAAGVLFVLPSALLLWALSYIYVTFGQIGWINAAFTGLKPAVTAIVLAAVWRIGRRALKTPSLWLIAAAAFAALFFFHVPFPAVVVLAGAIGYLTRANTSRSANEQSPEQPSTVHSIESSNPTAGNSLQRTLKVTGVGLALWWFPVVLAACWLGWKSTAVQQGIFFSKAALITFGGAYAVLPYVGQQAVEHYSWLSASQMLDGLGLAETTPGPLIMVLQFFGFLGGWNHPGVLSPLAAATTGAAITTWTTFVPSYLFIFLGAPFIERLRSVSWLNQTLTAVTAAVVGVILNLAIWFGIQVFFPRAHEPSWPAIALAVAAFVTLQKFKTSIIAVVAGGALLGVVAYFVTQ
ncbi:MAG: chromate efflux transporter [Nibricoccus sp.]